MSRSVHTVCTTVTDSINFVTKPRADAPARCTVERESDATLVIVSVCKWTMIEVWSGSVRGSSNSCSEYVWGIVDKAVDNFVHS